MRAITQPRMRRSEVMQHTTLRDFSGGLTVVDSDLNLSPRFAVVLDNMQRRQDGSIGLRYGTRMIGNLTNAVANTGSLGSDPFLTVNGSAVVSVIHAGHSLIAGHYVAFSGSTSVNGIPAGELNATHEITEVVNSATYRVVVTTTATSAGTGGGSGVEYSESNNGASDDIVNMTYFQDRLVMVLEDGVVLEANDVGVSRIIFNNAIASRVNSTVKWGLTSFVSFAVFNGQLIACNGKDKPLLIDFNNTFPCQYLVDLASGSNANTPIARYVLGMNNYLVMAGDLVNPSRVYVSNAGASGTWAGDAAPNDAVNVDVGKFVQSQDNTIRGLGRFRDRLAVAFSSATVLGSLGTYDGSDHVPEFNDVIQNNGTIAHRSMVDLGDDLLMCDNIGVPALGRAQFTGQLKPQRVSELVDPEIQKRILALTVGGSEDGVFAVHNQREAQYMLFIPDGNTPATTTETVCYVYTVIPAQRVRAWSIIKGWNWTCGTTSALRRVFFAKGRKYYAYGAEEDKIYGDKIDDPDITDSTNGDAIAFTWELPWADFDNRALVKAMRYFAMSTEGTAQFTVQLFVDNIYKDSDGNLDPTLTMDFVGGDRSGYGGGEQPFGGGRRTIDERSFAWTTKCRIAKFRFSGSTTSALGIIDLTVSYQAGGMRR